MKYNFDKMHFYTFYLKKSPTTYPESEVSHVKSSKLSRKVQQKKRKGFIGITITVSDITKLYEY